MHLPREGIHTRLQIPPHGVAGDAPKASAKKSDKAKKAGKSKKSRKSAKK
jgi:hypothetical protein